MLIAGITGDARSRPRLDEFHLVNTSDRRVGLTARRPKTRKVVFAHEVPGSGPHRVEVEFSVMGPLKGSRERIDHLCAANAVAVVLALVRVAWMQGLFGILR